VHEALAIVALAAALTAAVVRTRRVPEAAVALGGAALLLATGALTAAAARGEARALAPTLALLAGLLVLGDGCRRAGLFESLSLRLAAGARGEPLRLLALVFAAAAVVTAVLGLDATVVLLTPAVYAAAARVRALARPHLFACTHLANSASLLLPVSNLTNLLAFRATGLSFTRFAALMTLPWLAAIAAEWAGIRRRFAADLRGRGAAPGERPAALPRLPVAVLAATLAGLAAGSPLGVEPAWPVLAGAAVMLAAQRVPPREAVLAADPFVARVRARPRADRGGRNGQRARLGDRRARPGGRGAAGAAGRRDRRRRAREPAQQPARAAGAAAGGGRRGPGDGARRADRGERRAEPHLHGLAGDAAVAARAARARGGAGARRVRAPRRRDGAAGARRRYRRAVARLASPGMRVLVWVRAAGWEACADAAAALDGEIVLLAAEPGDPLGGAGQGLLGRHRPPPPPHDRLGGLADDAARELLAAARERLGRPAETLLRRGHVEHEVLAAAEGFDLLVLARDGGEPGPRSLHGPVRFVADHARCAVLLVWP
jgi:arsenical pump membrane protein